MFGLGPWEIALIVFVVIVVFGVGKLPEVGTALGEGIKNFKKSYKDTKSLDSSKDDSDSSSN